MALFSGKKTSLDSRVQTLEEGQKTLLEQNGTILTMLGKLTGTKVATAAPKKQAAPTQEDPAEEDPDAECEDGEDASQEDGEPEGEDGTEDDASQEDGEGEGEDDPAPAAKKKAVATPKQTTISNAAIMRELRSLRKQVASASQKSQAGDLASKVGIAPIRRGTQTESSPTAMKRADWQQLSAKARSAFLSGGGKLTD